MHFVSLKSVEIPLRLQKRDMVVENTPPPPPHHLTNSLLCRERRLPREEECWKSIFDQICLCLLT